MGALGIKIFGDSQSAKFRLRFVPQQFDHRRVRVKKLVLTYVDGSDAVWRVLNKRSQCRLGMAQCFPGLFAVGEVETEGGEVKLALQDYFQGAHVEKSGFTVS